MERNPRYFPEIVYLRAIAILAVISIHVSGSFDTMNSISFLTLLYMSVFTVSQFAVPLFVCISGFVLYNKYQGSYPLAVFYKKRLRSVVPQYTIFSGLTILAVYCGYSYFGKTWNISVSDILYQYVTGTAFYHLWFFVLLIQLYILYPFIEKIFTRSAENNTTAAGLLVFLLMVQIVYQIFSVRDMGLVGMLTIFSAYLFYFVLGMYVNTQYENYKNRAGFQVHPFGVLSALTFATIPGIGLWSMEYFRNTFSPHMIFLIKGLYAIVAPWYYILIFSLCLYLAVKISGMIPHMMTRCLEIIGKYSFGIYLVHAFILSAFIAVFTKLSFTINNPLYYPTVFLLVLSCSLAVVFIINRFPWHEYVIGSAR